MEYLYFVHLETCKGLETWHSSLESAKGRVEFLSECFVPHKAKIYKVSAELVSVDDISTQQDVAERHIKCGE